MIIFKPMSAEQICINHRLAQGGSVQKFIDSECLRRCDRYTPKDTGELIRSGIGGTVIGSGIRGTVIGSGELVYTAPYARKNYYSNSGHGASGTASGGLRGRLWFERMKAAHVHTILAGAAQIAGCRYRG